MGGRRRWRGRGGGVVGWVGGGAWGLFFGGGERGAGGGVGRGCGVGLWMEDVWGRGGPGGNRLLRRRCRLRERAAVGAVAISLFARLRP